MKIVFSKKADGTISATNAEVFKSFFVEEKDGWMSNNKTLYALIDDKAIRVIVLNTSCGVKLMFEQDDKTFKRMYIKDGDVLYTTKEDIDNIIKRDELKNKAKEKFDDLSKSITDLSKEIAETMSNVDWSKKFNDFSNIFNESFDNIFNKYSDKFGKIDNSKESLEAEREKLLNRLKKINEELDNVFTEVK